MLEIFKSYNDLCLEIEVLKEQIQLTQNSLEYWFGIKLNNPYSSGIPFSSNGVHRFGAVTGLIQAEKTIDALNKQNERLEQLETAKKRIEELLSQFQSLEYEIAFKRYVEGKSLKEIASELNKSYDYIRELMSKMKKVI
jgi:hypothetical protein